MVNLVQPNSLSTNENPTAAPAVVIGCSHSNTACEHGLHAEQKDFYTIDSNPEINPDLCLNIVEETPPETLHQRFQLTILENLPYEAYNRNELDARYFQKGNGHLGMEHVREITAPEGFILIVGNERSMHYRNSLAQLNYLELAKYPHEKAPDQYVLLIPNNQNIKASEVFAQINTLAPPLKAVIELASTSKGYQALKPTSYCPLNYTTSPHNKELIEELNTEIAFHLNQKPYDGSISVFGYRINLDYSRDEKIHAASTLVSVLLGNEPIKALTPHEGPLKNGRLAYTIALHSKGLPLETLICEYALENSSSKRMVEQLGGDKVNLVAEYEKQFVEDKEQLAAKVTTNQVVQNKAQESVVPEEESTKEDTNNTDDSTYSGPKN